MKSKPAKCVHTKFNNNASHKVFTATSKPASKEHTCTAMPCHLAQLTYVLNLSKKLHVKLDWCHNNYNDVTTTVEPFEDIDKLDCISEEEN